MVSHWQIYVSLKVAYQTNKSWQASKQTKYQMLNFFSFIYPIWQPSQVHLQMKARHVLESSRGALVSGAWAQMVLVRWTWMKSGETVSTSQWPEEGSTSPLPLTAGGEALRRRGPSICWTGSDQCIYTHSITDYESRTRKQNAVNNPSAFSIKVTQLPVSADDGIN